MNKVIDILVIFSSPMRLLWATDNMFKVRGQQAAFK